MAGWRELKAQALKGVHKTFEVPAVYVVLGGSLAPVRVNVRVHRKQIVERLPFEDFSDAAGAFQLHDRIIFDGAELPDVLARAFVIISATEGYVTGPSKPKRDNYIWVDVTPMTAAEIAGVLGQVDAAAPAWEGILA